MLTFGYHFFGYAIVDKIKLLNFMLKKINYVTLEMILKKLKDFLVGGGVKWVEIALRWT
jgi:hypothetical protein